MMKRCINNFVKMVIIQIIIRNLFRWSRKRLISNPQFHFLASYDYNIRPGIVFKGYK